MRGRRDGNDLRLGSEMCIRDSYSSFVPNPIGMNSCCCAPQPAPYAKRNKRGGGCG